MVKIVKYADGTVEGSVKPMDTEKVLREKKELTKKQFENLSQQYTPLYIADEWDDRGRHWAVWAFYEVEGEYKERTKRGAR